MLLKAVYCRVVSHELDLQIWFQGKTGADLVVGKGCKDADLVLDLLPNPFRIVWECQTHLLVAAGWREMW